MVPVDHSRQFPTHPTGNAKPSLPRSRPMRNMDGNAKPSLPRGRPMRNMDERQHQHCFVSAHFAELSWGRESTIYVPPSPTTPMLLALPQSGRRSQSTTSSWIPDDSRRSPRLNLHYQQLGQCATWIKGRTDTAFYPRILPSLSCPSPSHGV